MALDRLDPAKARQDFARHHLEQAGTALDQGGALFSLDPSRYKVKDDSQWMISSKNVFLAGPMGVHITLTPGQLAGLPSVDAAPAAVTHDVGFWATPWPQLVVLLLLVGVFFGVRWLLQRSRYLSGKFDAAETYVALGKPEPDTTLTFAQARQAIAQLSGEYQRARKAS